jgi:hypothetical protein
MRKLTSESRVLRRGSLGDLIDARSREGRFLTAVERELTQHVGGAPSITQKLLIRRLARGLLRLELLDERVARGEWTDHDARTFSALSNQVRLLTKELGLKQATEKALPSLTEVLADRKARR